MTTTTVQTDTQLASRLRLAVMRLARILRQKAQDQITPSQLSALVSVERDGPVTLGELAALEKQMPRLPLPDKDVTRSPVSCARQ